MLEGCRLFKRYWNIPAVHSVAGVQAVYAVSEPTSQALCCRGAGCLSSVGTYLLGTVLLGAGCLSGVGTYLPGMVVQGCREFNQGWNVPPGHCWAEMQAV